MWLFGFAIGFGLLAIAAFIISRIADKEKSSGEDISDRGIVNIVFSILLVIALGLTFFSLFDTVGTKQLAVKTTFGKPTGVANNGWTWKAPWEKVNKIDAAVQTNTYANNGSASGDQQRGARGTCVNIRLASSANACVNVSVRWQIKEAGVQYLFQNFKDNDGITDELVLRNLQATMNAIFSTYNPVNFDETTGVSKSTPLSGSTGSYSDQVTNSMREQLEQWVDIQTVSIPVVYFDNSTQDRISGIQNQIAATQQAKEALKTNQAQAAANAAIAASVDNSPGVLQSKCLDIVSDSIERDRPLPAGFSCFGGGSSVAVAVPAK